jgi:hypothetical protein
MWRLGVFLIFVVLWSIDQLVRPRRRGLRTTAARVALHAVAAIGWAVDHAPPAVASERSGRRHAPAAPPVFRPTSRSRA